MPSRTFATAPRLAGVLSARPGVAASEIAGALRGYRAALRRAHGEDLAGLRIARRGEHDPWGQTVGDRKLDAPIDGVVELTLAPEADPRRLLEATRGAADALSGAFDPARSTLVAGIVHFVKRGEGAHLMLMAGRRDPGWDAPTFSRWWLEQHGPLALGLVGDDFLSYEQLHGDDALTAQACEAAGLSGPRYQMYESNAVVSLEGFLRRLSDPAVVRRIYEDEIGYLDHGGMRVAWAEPL